MFSLSGLRRFTAKAHSWNNQAEQSRLLSLTAQEAVVSAQGFLLTGALTLGAASDYSNPLPPCHQYCPYILFPFGSLRFSPDPFPLKCLREHAIISFILNISRQAQYLEIMGL